MAIDPNRLTLSSVNEAVSISRQALGDSRGWFSRLLDVEDFLPSHRKFDIVNINNSFSKFKGTLRGLHWQIGSSAEAKLVRCIQGSVLDIIVDVRKDSPTFGSNATFVLDAASGELAYVPRGCAHGVFSLTDNAEIIYASDRPYVQSAERGMRWNDPFVNLSLPFQPSILSQKDSSWPAFSLDDELDNC